MTRIVPFFLAPLFVASLLAQKPGGWFLAGNNPRNYQVNTETEGKVTLPEAQSNAEGFGTYMYQSPCDAYAGKRIRLQAQVRPEAVGRWAGLWMRVDATEKGKVLAFDNMQQRPISGTKDWKEYSVVLNVKKDCGGLA